MLLPIPPFSLDLEKIYVVLIEVCSIFYRK
ncbi:Uncharacterised protein [Vibrio cholerae]|nr:Uncharacterised protein [Vibrio cholerae]